MTIATEKAGRGDAPGLAPRPGARLPGRLVALLRGESERTRLQRDAMLAFGVRLLSAAILYLSQIVLARWMGGFEYGIYVLVWTWILVLGGLSHLGLGMVMMRMVPEYRARGELALLRGLLCHGRLTALAASTVVALIGLWGLQLLGAHISTSYVWPAYLALVCLPIMALSEVQDGIGRGGGWLAVALLPPYVLRPLLVLVLMGAAYGLGLHSDARTAIGAAVVATWASAGLQALLLHRRLVAELPPGPRRCPRDLWLATSLPLLAIAGSELLLQNTDLLVIAVFLSPEEGALYYAAAKTMALVLFVHYAVGTAMAKRFPALGVSGDRAELQAFVADAARWTFWPSLAAALLLLVLGRPLLSLFGPQFTDGYVVMFILVLGFLGRAAMGPSELLLNMLGEQKVCAAVAASMAVLNLALQLIAVPRLGISGAALATATVLSLGAALNARAARRRLGLDIAIWQARRHARPGGSEA